MKLTGSQIILEVLKQKGVDTLFGYPGGAVIPFFDALYDETHFQVIRPAHEQNGVHAADGYARSTGKLGVFIATSGPGATNTITGIASAYMDSSPLLVICGQVPNTLIGKDSFQEIDITGMTLSITKHNCLVRDIKQLQQAISEACDIAISGRPGPVVVDVPKDVFLATYDWQEAPFADASEEILTDLGDLDEIIQKINAAKRPVIYAGGGVRISNTEHLLRALAHKAQIPVVNSFMGLGTIPREDPLSLGFVGMHGFKEANLAVSNCDLLLAIGARFSDRVTGNPKAFAPKADIVHIDIDHTESQKNTDSHLHSSGDFSLLLPQIIAGVQEATHTEWLEEIKGWTVAQKSEGLFTPDQIIATINATYDKDTVVVTDVGQHQMWTGQFWNHQNGREFVSSGGLGTMGFGLGAAIGAQLGNPDKRTVLFIGDGCFRMSSQELVSLATYNLPVRVVMFNNGALGMVRQWQKLFQNKRYSATDIGQEINYTMLAGAYGIRAYQVETLEALAAALEESKDLDVPVFFECKIHSDLNVYPMVPAGKAIDELILG